MIASGRDHSGLNSELVLILTQKYGTAGVVTVVPVQIISAFNSGVVLLWGGGGGGGGPEALA